MEYFAVMSIAKKKRKIGILQLNLSLVHLNFQFDQTMV
jgi:hypothetical protein